MRYAILFTASALTLAACAGDGPRTSTLESKTTPNNWTIIKLFEGPDNCAAYYARPAETYSEWEPFKYVVCTDKTKTMWDTTQYSGVGKMRHTTTKRHAVETVEKE